MIQLISIVLTDFILLVTFCSPWKHQKTDVFRGYRKKPVSWNGLTNFRSMFRSIMRMNCFCGMIDRRKASTLQCLVSTKSSYILKQIYSFRLYVCLSISELLADTRYLRVKAYFQPELLSEVLHQCPPQATSRILTITEP